MAELVTCRTPVNGSIISVERYDRHGQHRPIKCWPFIIEFEGYLERF
jgi:hypothetical protein